jgi:uncharacterized protein
MRRSSDLPSSRARWPRISGRGVLLGVAALVFAVVVFGRAIAQFYVDALWHDALGRDDVFWGQLGAKLTLLIACFLIFLALASANLYIADRAAPTVFPANVHPYVERFHELFGHRLRFIRYGTAFVLAFILALPATAQWQSWLLFRNSVPFGVSDPQFDIDVGFYVFRLPFISFAIDWLFAALIVVLLLTLAAHLLNGGVLFTSSMPTVRQATRIHIAALLALLAAVKAADYWYTRYDLTNERRGFVQGATYTVVNAQIPALMLLMLIALLTAALYLWTIRTNRWRVPLVASALWLVVAIVGGVAYPAFVQAAIVRPNQQERELEYIARNIEATMAAMNIDEVEQRPVSFEPINAADVEADIDQIQNVRLLNPGVMLQRFSLDRGEATGLKITDLDVDRRTAVGGLEQTMVAARELDLDTISNTSWQSRHLVNTRGCGLVVAPVGRLDRQDKPLYENPQLERPELYFSPSIGGYAITGTNGVEETPCGEPGRYQGDAGVRMGGFTRRAAFALAFLDYNVLAAGSIDDTSQMLWVRSVVERSRKLAPFLDLDGDPYPVIVDGAVQWVIDGYTTTSRYPYAQRVGNVQLSNTSGLPRDANYIRNSVKVVVDAYTGEVTFYVVDELDPIVQAWSRVFPDLFTPGAQMPAELREHLRYPEDLFRVQTDLYSKYQVPAPQFFDRIGAWSVAQAPSVEPLEVGSGAAPADATAAEQAQATEFAAESSADRFVPYYTVFDDDAAGEQFVMLRPFVPFTTDDRRTELQAYITASSDPESYGDLVSYVVSNPNLPPGPLRAANQAETQTDIGQTISLLDRRESGTSVVFGDVQLMPVGNGLVYLRPVYVARGNSPEFRFVIASYNDRAALACDLGTAIAQLFSGFDAPVGDRVQDGQVLRAGACGDNLDIADETDEGAGDETVDTPSATTAPPTTADGTVPDLPDDATPEQLIAAANDLFDEAEQALEDEDLATYQERVERGAALIARADALLRETGAPPSTTGG